MTQKSSSIAEYISWLLQQYNEAKKQTSPQTLYRLVEIKEKTTYNYELSFQLIGKSAIFKSTPEKILTNEKIIEHFSSKDISIITQLACKKLNQPKNTIVGKSFSRTLNKLLFKVKDLDKKIINECPASELSINKELIQNMAPEDAHMIGYATAMEVFEKENSSIKILREKNNSSQ